LQLKIQSRVEQNNMASNPSTWKDPNHKARELYIVTLSTKKKKKKKKRKHKAKKYPVNGPESLCIWAAGGYYKKGKDWKFRGKREIGQGEWIGPNDVDT